VSPLRLPLQTEATHGDSMISLIPQMMQAVTQPLV